MLREYFENKPRRSSILTIFHYSFLICIAAIYSIQPLYAQPELVFSSYVQTLVSEDWEKAETYWLPEEIQKSKRLGITYTGIKAKYDCASPLISALGKIRSGEVQVTVTDVVHREDWSQVSVQLTTLGESSTTTYYLVKSEGDWRLVSPLFVHSRNWKRHDTQYATVHFDNDSLINEHALQDLDRFVASMGEHLELSEAEMERLEKEKIDYYFCNEEEIEKFTGFSTFGMTNLQFDAIISRRLPHYHEVVHLLVNYALKELTLYTLPCLQEGVAVCFGGRWDKSPQVVFQVGHFTLAQKFFQLEDVLTYKRFHEIVGNPDFSYPISGIFVKFLIEQFGMERFELLYRNFSGTDAEVRAFSVDHVQSKISEILGKPWSEIQPDFEKYWQQFEFSGLVPGGIVANESKTTLKSTNLSVHIGDLEDAYIFEIQSTTDNPSGLILMKDKLSSGIENYQSGLFTDHLPNASYDGEAYGVQFSANEAGLYNYYTDNLVAKYISSFAPSNEYWNVEKRIMRFRLEKAVLNQNISDFQLSLTEP